MLRTLTSVSARLFARGLRTTSGGGARPRRTPRLAIEALEAREVPATITGRVWNDLNSNGIQDGGEPGVPGVQVESNGGVITHTDASGNYSLSVSGFSMSGQAWVRFTQLPAGAAGFTQQDVGSNDAVDSDADPATGYGYAMLVNGQADIDAGVVFAGSASGGGAGTVVGRVWADANGDGIQDNSEGGVTGVGVELHAAGGATVATTTTGADGSYAFSNQPAGSYYVQFVKPSSPANAAFTTPNVGPDATDSDADATGKTDTFLLADGQEQDRDAGLLNVTSNTSGSGGPAVTITKVRDTVEGYTGAKAGEFRVTLSAPSSQSVAVQLGFSGRATFGTDYTLSGSGLTGTVVTIPAGSTTAAVDVTAVQDGVFEETEDVVATVEPANDGTYTPGSPAQATVLIADSQAPNDFPAEDSDCGCSPSVLSGGSDTGGSGAVEEGGSKARYADGVLSYQDTDLSTDGFGQVLALTRSFANGFGYAGAGYDGNNTVVSDLPYLKTDSAGVVFAVTNGSTARFFDPVGGGYAPRHYSQDSLTYDSAADEFTLTDAGGDHVVFFGFESSRPAIQRGALKSFADAAGNVTTVAGFTADGKPTALYRSDWSPGRLIYPQEQFAFTYITGGPNDGKVQRVDEQGGMPGRPWTTVRSVVYTYYDGTTAGGTAGDLKTAVVKDATGAVLDTKYARYYTADTTDGSGNPIGYAGGLKMSFSGASYERFAAWCAANSTTVDAATDAQAAVYADAQYQYDEIHRVTQAVLQGEGCSTCAGGEGTYAYAYATSQFADGYNAWKFKTTETLPDGNQNVVYANFAGQTVLSVYQDTTTHQAWPTYRQYDAQGRLVLEAGPAAVASYSEATPGLATLNATGLISTTTYYTTTTANATTVGGVAGYVDQTFVQRGAGGTPVLQSTTDYIQAPGGAAVYLVADQTQYRNTDGTGAQTTSHAYTFFPGSVQPQQVTTTLPAVTTAENGPGTATSTTTVYDARGRVIWERDAAGYLTYTQYDESTGAVTRTIRDVDTTRTADFGDLPSGWATPPGGGLHLITDYVVDAFGRTTAETDPNGHVTYTVYNDPAHEVRTYAGWNAATNTPTGPTQVSREDRTHGYTETLTMSATPDTAGGVPTGTEAISGIQSLSRSVLNQAGQVVDTDEYFDLTGVTYDQSAVTLGTAGTNYNRTQTDYDDRGRMDRTVSPAGTITRTVYDGLGRAVGEWVGTDDTPTSGEWSPTNLVGTNMVQTSASEYDGGGVGDGLLTKSTQMPGSPYANRVTQAAYDWRDRQVAVKEGVEASESTTVNRPITYQVLDNLGEVTETDQYDGDGLSITTDANGDGVPDQPSAGALRAKGMVAYDELGRAYQEQTFSVDPTTGAVSANALTTGHWFDARGLEVKTASPGGLVAKTVYDGAGRAVTEYTTNGGGDAGYADAGNVTGDVVLTQTETQYDANGNALEVTTRDRFHDQPDTATGALGTPTTGVHARVSYQVTYYDLADRPTDTVDVGTNGGTAYTRPGTAPARSDTALVTSYGYDPAGRQFSVTDPKGLVGETFYDLAGRTTKTIQDYVDGVVSNADDKTVEYTYAPDGQQKTLAADLTGGGHQVTANVYGVSTPGGLVSNDLLKEVDYPDPTTGDATSAEKDTYTYDQLGEVLTKTDRNGNVHAYTYDVLGRQISDAVTTLGTGVNGAVLRIDTAYDGQGNPYLITSYDAASGGNVVNQVERVYNGLGQLTREYQAVSGAVNLSTTPYVGYTYSEMAGGANHSRLTQIAYPTATGASGKTIAYDYGTAGGLNDRISRLNALIDNTGTVAESYQYLGLGTVVERDHPEIHVNLTYIKLAGDPTGDAGDQYTGLDRFGRVVDQRWRRVTGTVADLDRRVYTYDRDGNVLYAENASSQAGSAARSEGYTYDGLGQLTQYQRGTLTKDANGHPTGVTSVLHSQQWALDAVGNFTSQTTDGTAQTRTHDKQNEILSVSGATTPTYDNNGNLTRQENGDAQVYDAWNRLAQVKASPTGSSIATYRYDGLGRRVSWTVSSGTRAFYYSDAWQVLEERVGGTARDQYVWGAGYVDDLVLRDEDADGVSTNGLEQRIYALQDANYNVRALVGAASGLVVERYLYYPYGSVAITDSAYTSRASSSYNWTNLFQGLKWQAAVDLYVGRERAYSPTLGRWLQNDPIGFAAGDVNLYRFVSCDPASHTDPSGQDEYDVDFEPAKISDFAPVLKKRPKTWDKIKGTWEKPLTAPGTQNDTFFIDVSRDTDGVVSYRFASGVWFKDNGKCKNSIIQIVKAAEFVDGEKVSESTIVEGWSIKRGKSATPDIHLFSGTLSPPAKRRVRVDHFIVGDGTYDGQNVKGDYQLFSDDDPDNEKKVKWTHPGQQRDYVVRWTVESDRTYTYVDESAGVDEPKKKK